MGQPVCPGGTLDISRWLSERREREPPESDRRLSAPQRGAGIAVEPIRRPIRGGILIGARSGGYARLPPPANFHDASGVGYSLVELTHYPELAALSRQQTSSLLPSGSSKKTA